jgi:hypothetical protein
MVWAVLGLINGKTLLVAIIVGLVAFVVCQRPNKEEDQ